MFGKAASARGRQSSRRAGWVVLVGFCLVGVAAARPAAPNAACAWRVSPGAAATGWSVLYGVDARASDDVWAVGVRAPNTDFVQGLTLAEHWTGSRWTIVPTPGWGVLLDVTAVTARDAWAVGARARGNRALIEHWDGKEWNISPTPDVGPSVLQGIDARSANDVWAVGSRKSWSGIGYTGPGKPLIEHWDGTRWRLVAGAAQSQKAALHDVSFAPNGDVWAIGETDRGQCVQRFAGDRWEFVPVPGRCGGDTIQALGTHDVWADMGGAIRQRLNDHWLKRGALGAFSLTAISDTDVWVAGAVYPNSSEEHHVYYAHWNGVRWQHVPGPASDDTQQSFGDAEMADISAVSTHDIWAAGDRAGQIRIEHYSCG